MVQLLYSKSTNLLTLAWQIDMPSSRIQRKLFHFLIDSSILSFHLLLMSFQCIASDLSIHCTTVSCHYRSQSSSTVISTPPCHWRPAYQKQLDKDAFDRDWQEAGDEHLDQHTRPQRKQSEVGHDSFSSGSPFEIITDNKKLFFLFGKRDSNKLQTKQLIITRVNAAVGQKTTTFYNLGKSFIIKPFL